MSEEIKSNLNLEGLSEQEAKEFKKLLTKFVKSYAKKKQDVSDVEWLTSEFKDSMPKLSEEEANKMAVETIDSVREYDENLASLNTACKQGKSKEQWLADKVAKASAGVSVVEYGHMFL